MKQRKQINIVYAVCRDFEVTTSNVALPMEKKDIKIE
jgi:hypothetical protein